ncbi:hypothetical protein FHP25_05495 [Vineibacter terrae]|uniref:Uncharacterized protein n=1 Tax=Vineibacter terrae TaxID=2586908 RepID=A0A5C8PSZ4_9HYPH|nr:hypothetical protein [Vineibacter terrae]TXL80480.1 hypothetical protein FHP25_05495 [Vineibacter terrae]
MKDHAGYMERGGVFGTLSGMAPPGLRRALEPWGGMLNPLVWTPGPSIQQMLQSSGDLTRATLAGQPIGMLNALAGVTMGAIGAVPGGRAVTRSAKATADLAMDLASRQSRAEKMFPVEVYHGTAYDFDAFDPRKYGQTMPGPVSGLGGLGIDRSEGCQPLRGDGGKTTRGVARAGHCVGREAATGWRRPFRHAPAPRSQKAGQLSIA